MKLHLLTFLNPKHSSEEGKKGAIEMLTDAAIARGHTLEMIHARNCQLEFLRTPHIRINNKRPRGIHVLIVRPNFRGIDLDLHIGVIKQFELAGIRVINNHLAVIRAKNKLRQLQILTRHTIPMPRSYVVRSPDFIEDMVNNIGSYPVIIKSLVGSFGLGVAIVESQRALRSLIEFIVHDDSSTGPVIIQEYMKESVGRDLRVFVVGGKIIAAMERIARKRGEFRSNFSLGGQVRVAELTAKEKEIALCAAKVCDLEIAGVDIIRSSDGPKVLEINSNPGLDGITQATGIDVAGAIIDYAVSVAQAFKKQSRQRVDSSKAL